MSNWTEQLRPASRTRLYHEIAKQIIALVQEGQLKIGDMLPGERELCRTFQVSRGPLREALKALELSGVVSIVPGKGTFIVGVPAGIDGDSLNIVLGMTLFLEVLQVRRLLEPEVCRLVAEGKGQCNVKLLGTYLAAMEKSIDDEETFNEMDVKFHVVIADGLKNGFLSNLFTMLKNKMSDCLKFVRTTWSGSVESRRTILEDHRKIYEAIRAGDGQSAYAAMMEHLTFIEGYLKSLWKEEGVVLGVLREP